MRYKSKYDRLALRKDDGTTLYQFFNGVFVIGDPTTNATPGTDAIDTTDLHVSHPTGASALNKVGLDTIFWEAPPITPGVATVTDGTWYEILTAPVTYDGTTYTVVGQRFKGTATADSTGAGTFAIAEPAEHYKADELDEREEYFKVNNLGDQHDEATWDASIHGADDPADGELFTR